MKVLDRMKKQAWKISLHGGHSGTYCDHARGTLHEILEAAVLYGYHTFGITEHAPRVEDQYLYPEEIALGWNSATLMQLFEQYAQDSILLAEEFSDRLVVLRGFEAEAVPPDRYVTLMQEYRERLNFDYVLGSVHWVDGILIDGSKEEFLRAADRLGSIEALTIRYYERVAEMAQTLQPNVVGHFDIIRKNADSDTAVDTPTIRAAAMAALETIRDNGCLLEINTAGYRKNIGRPYLAPWMVETAHRMGIEFCFGDDSHAPGDVGLGMEEARAYLLGLGVTRISTLIKKNGSISQNSVPL